MSSTTELDPELRAQINSLFEKSFTDLNTKVSKLVSKHYAKVIKDLSKVNKSSGSGQSKTSASRQSLSVVIPSTKSSVGMKRGPAVHKAPVEYSDDEEYSSEYSE